MTIINNTDRDIKQIEELEEVGVQKNLWREKNVRIFADPNDDDMVYTIGTSFDETKCVITREPRKEFSTAISYWTHGKKQYVSQ